MRESGEDTDADSDSDSDFDSDFDFDLGGVDGVRTIPVRRLAGLRLSAVLCRRTSGSFLSAPEINFFSVSTRVESEESK